MSYEGLNASELDVQFLTDIQFTIKDGDQFSFTDDKLEES
jgi:hypothetical protein